MKELRGRADDGELVELLRARTDDSSLEKLADALKRLGESLAAYMSDYAERVGRDLSDIWAQLDEYEQTEILHPKKKKRGSKRRSRRARNERSAD